MCSRPVRRLARWGGALALLLGPGLALAQDGQREVEAPVTNPETNKLKPRVQTSTPPVRTSRSTLPGVPATGTDPAPSGTRAVPAAPRQGPGQTTAPGNPRAAGPQAPRPVGARGPARSIKSIEGVVVKLEPPNTKRGELIRIVVDPSQDWFSYANDGPQGVESKRDAKGNLRDKPDDADSTAEADKDADAKDDAAPDTRAAEPQSIELTFIRNSRLVTFARTRDGVDLFGSATESSPSTTRTGRGVIGRSLPDAPGPKETNFTNIKEGSFVAVRYRQSGGRNEVVNASLIEFPLNDPTEATPGANSARGNAPGARPARVPAIPAEPVGGNALPR